MFDFIFQNIASQTHIRFCTTKRAKDILLYYQAYILPILDYGSNTLGSTSGTNIERLSKLQKRAARIILEADIMTPSSYMFEQLNWISITKRLMYICIIKQFFLSFGIMSFIVELRNY